MPTFKAQRTTYPYVYLHEASYYSLQEAIENEKGSFFKLMNSMLSATFSMEGYLNFVGEKKISDWNKKERQLGREGRLKVLLQELGMHPNMSERPFQTYNELFIFRDALVHSRVADLTLTGSLEDYEEHPPKPLPEWEKLINLQSAQRFFDDTSQMIRLMHKKAGFERDAFATPWVGQWEIKP